MHVSMGSLPVHVTDALIEILKTHVQDFNLLSRILERVIKSNSPLSFIPCSYAYACALSTTDHVRCYIKDVICNTQLHLNQFVSALWESEYRNIVDALSTHPLFDDYKDRFFSVIEDFLTKTKNHLLANPGVASNVIYNMHGILKSDKTRAPCVNNTFFSDESSTTASIDLFLENMVRYGIPFSYLLTAISNVGEYETYHAITKEKDFDYFTIKYNELCSAMKPDDSCVLVNLHPANKQKKTCFLVDTTNALSIFINTLSKNGFNAVIDMDNSGIVKGFKKGEYEPLFGIHYIISDNTIVFHINRLVNKGYNNFIFIGTCSRGPETKTGDIVIGTECLSFSGTIHTGYSHTCIQNNDTCKTIETFKLGTHENMMTPEALCRKCELKLLQCFRHEMFLSEFVDGQLSPEQKRDFFEFNMQKWISTFGSHIHLTNGTDPVLKISTEESFAAIQRYQLTNELPRNNVVVGTVASVDADIFHTPDWFHAISNRIPDNRPKAMVEQLTLSEIFETSVKNNATVIAVLGVLGNISETELNVMISNYVFTQTVKFALKCF